MMIKNNKQLKQSKLEQEKLLQEIEMMPIGDVLSQMQKEAYECRLDDLTQEIEEYETLVQSEKSTLKFDIHNLEKSIISLRIASRYTQRELAEKIGVAEQQIQRYEQQEYQKASFERIIEIAGVLAEKVELAFLLKQTAKTISFFNDKPQLQQKTMAVKTKLQETGTLLPIGA
jgi:transcriptional regulator with XRE-family HTH domain